jgi:endonuclease YncB( thermonuclease family)
VPINRKRRIFRGSSLAAPRGRFTARPTLLVGVFGAIVAAGAALLFLPSTPFGRVPAGPEQLVADATRVAVVDGATLRLGERVVRLRGIVAPARGDVCRGTGGISFDCGTASAEALANLVRDRALTCRLAGRDREGFLQARCDAGNGDLARAQVTAGWARPDADANDLRLLSDDARAKRHGVWAGAAF